jgi:hypothetical protein
MPRKVTATTAPKAPKAAPRDKVYALTLVGQQEPEIVIGRYFRVSGGSLTIMIGVAPSHTKPRVWAPGTWSYMEEIIE